MFPMFKLRCSRNSKHTGNCRIGLKSIAGTEPHQDEVQSNRSPNPQKRRLSGRPMPDNRILFRVSISPARIANNIQDVLCCVRNVRAWPKDRLDPRIVEKLIILLRDYAAADDDDIFSARVPERLNQLRRKGFVPRCLT